MANNWSPAFTSAPSATRTFITWPLTRGRISTASMASRRPVKLRVTGMIWEMGEATPTEVSGMAPGGDPVAPAASAANFGLLLFTKYQLPFELIGFLLLAAMIGVIYISRRQLVQENTATTQEASKE